MDGETEGLRTYLLNMKHGAGVFESKSPDIRLPILFFFFFLHFDKHIL